MKTIAKFNVKEKFGNKFHYAKVVYLEEENCYAVIHKYVTMDKEDTRLYNNINLAMYDFDRIIMFLLS